MKLYDGGRAPNPRRVRIFLAEKDISIPMVQVDIMGGGTRSDAISRLNPMMRIPILELDDGTPIAESVAICRYFEEVQPDPPLFGTDAADKAIVEMWNRRLELSFGLLVAGAIRHGVPAMQAIEPIQVAEWAAHCREQIPPFLDWLESDLGDRPHMAGETYSIADISALCFIDFMRVAGIRLGEKHPNLKRWHQSVSDRPSATA